MSRGLERQAAPRRSASFRLGRFQTTQLGFYLFEKFISVNELPPPGRVPTFLNLLPNALPPHSESFFALLQQANRFANHLAHRSVTTRLYLCLKTALSLFIQFYRHMRFLFNRTGLVSKLNASVPAADAVGS